LFTFGEGHPTLNILKFFFLGFVTFGLTGAFIGLIQRNENGAEDAIEETIVTHLTLGGDAYLSGSTREDNLVYRCKGEEMFSYGLASGSIVPVSIAASNHHLVSQEKFADKLKIASAVLASSIGVKLEDITVLQLASGATGKITVQEKIAFAIGSLSGYLVGFYLTSRQPPSCFAPQVLDKLNDRQYWNRLSHEFAKRSILRYCVIVDRHPMTLVSALSRLKNALSVMPQNAENAQLTKDLTKIETGYLASQDLAQGVVWYDTYNLGARGWICGRLCTPTGNQQALLHQAFPDATVVEITTVEELPPFVLYWLLVPHFLFWLACLLVLVLAVSTVFFFDSPREWALDLLDWVLVPEFWFWLGCLVVVVFLGILLYSRFV
jgi:hypothetical protein